MLSGPHCLGKSSLFFFSPLLMRVLYFCSCLCARLLREDDSVYSGPRGHALSADLGRGQAASLHRRDRRGMLDHPHGVQHLAVPPSQEKDGPEHELRRHPERYSTKLDDDFWAAPLF